MSNNNTKTSVTAAPLQTPTVPPTLAATIEAAVSDPDPVRAGWLANEAARWTANLMDRAGDVLLHPQPPTLDTLRKDLVARQAAFLRARNALSSTLSTAYLNPDAAAVRLRTALSSAGRDASQSDILTRITADPTELGVLRGGKVFGRDTRAAALAAISVLPERVRAATVTHAAARAAEAAYRTREQALADPAVTAQESAAATLRAAAQTPAAAHLPLTPPPSIAALALPPTSAPNSRGSATGNPNTPSNAANPTPTAPETLCHRLLWLAADRLDRVTPVDWKQHLATVTHPDPATPPTVPRDAVDAARAWQGRNERLTALQSAVATATSADRPGPLWLATYHRATHLATTMFQAAQRADSANDPLTTTHAHQIATAADALRPLCAAQTLLAVRTDAELHKGILATNQAPLLHAVAQQGQTQVQAQAQASSSVIQQQDALSTTNDQDLDLDHGMG